MNCSKSNSIVIVLVLYNTCLENCLSYQTLCNSIINSTLDYELLIYNNSNDIEIKSDFACKVINSTSNKMLSGAYNYALKYANLNNKKWLLLLDQDTEIDKDYFTKLKYYLEYKKENDNIVAVVPFLKANSKVISPHKNKFFNCMRTQINKPGLQNDFITALNSLSLLKVDFINSIGGFSNEFSLDMLDYWYYSKIYKENKKVYTLDIYINHNLSLSDMEKNMTTERYIKLIEAEKKYYSDFNHLTKFFYRVRLVFRTIKQFVLYKNKKFSIVTLKNIV